jgi:hypothetical protein
MEYQLLISDSSVNLQSQVRKMIEEGWEPQGGLALFIGHGGAFTCGQAMIKRIAA